ncbi:MAG: hypothetical protein ABSB91_01850 [Sedimentisphaerales bacterium]
MSIRDDIVEQMKNKTSEELINIWLKNDRTQWSDSAFEAIRQVLTERGIHLPQQIVSTVVEDTARQKRYPALKHRVLSLIALIVLASIAYWVWNNLGGGQGLMRNVLRNGILGAMLPFALYLLCLLVGGSSETASADHKEANSTLRSTDDLKETDIQQKENSSA